MIEKYPGQKAIIEAFKDLKKRRSMFPAEKEVWRNMLTRCYHPKVSGFKDYGGRGITVCDKWRDDVYAFIIDMGPRPEGFSLDRIDTDGHYEPDNCRWVSWEDQQNNKRGNKKITYKGETLPVSKWSKRTGISRQEIYARLRYGWPIELTLTAPEGTEYLAIPKPPRNSKFTYRGETKSLKQWADCLGLSYGLLCDRVRRRGWSIERAITTKKWDRVDN